MRIKEGIIYTNKEPQSINENESDISANLVKIIVGLLCFSSWEIEQNNKGTKEDELEGIRMHDYFNVSQHYDIMVED